MSQAQKRSLDVIVSSFDILSESNDVDVVLDAHERSLDTLPWEAKRRRGLAPGANDIPRARIKTLGAPSREQNPQTDIPKRSLSMPAGALEGKPAEVILVNSAGIIRSISRELVELESASAAANGKYDALDFLIGIDCEWRPASLSGDIDESPVALLQIGVPALNKVYLVDTLNLLRSGMPSSDKMEPKEAALADIIATIFGSKSLIKSGFQVAADLRRLAASFPHVAAFQSVEAVVELSTFARKVHPSAARHSLGSLQRLTKFVLGYDLDKEQQCSDWEARPLSPEQVTYASLDCILPPKLIEEMVEGAGRRSAQSILPHCTSSWRFLTMDGSCQEAITLLKAKRVVGNTFAVSQSWLTKNPAPAAPAMPAADGHPYIDKSGIARMPSHLVRINKPSPATWEESIGKIVGRSKGKCVGLIAAESLHEGTQLEFNPRSGFVPFQDGIVLFVNAPSPKSARRSKFPNEWLEDGRILTWYLRESDWQGGQSQVAKLLGFGDKPDVIEIEKESAVLFVRSQTNDFYCCGKCSVTAPLEEYNVEKKHGKGLVKLHLELSSFGQLRHQAAFKYIVQSMTSLSRSQERKLKNEDRAVEDAVTLDKDSISFQMCLAHMVIEGNVIDALGFALEAHKTAPKKRSIAAGIGCLKNVFARSNDPDVLKAVEVLDDTAATLGIF